MTEFLNECIGEHEYKVPRKDGNQRLVIDKALIDEFAEPGGRAFYVTTLYFEADYEDELRKTGFSKEECHCNP